LVSLIEKVCCGESTGDPDLLQDEYDEPDSEDDDEQLLLLSHSSSLEFPSLPEESSSSEELELLAEPWKIQILSIKSMKFLNK